MAAINALVGLLKAVAEECEAQNQAYHGKNRDDEDEDLCSFAYIAHFPLSPSLQWGLRQLRRWMVFLGV